MTGGFRAALLADVQRRLLDWYEGSARPLPWRQTRDPYRILVAEMMLQQTGVDRVLPKYAAFLQSFPTLPALAMADVGDVIRAWAGLGYNSRAVRLHAIARRIVEEHGGVFPSTPAELQRLSGIGPYTAGAIACFAFDQQVAFWDTNVRRVLRRLCVPDDSAMPLTERAMHDLAHAALPAGQAYAWHQALMDLGAQMCTVRTPTCLVCPMRTVCAYVEPAVSASHLREERSAYRAAPRPPQAPFVGSTRYYRGRIVAALRSLATEETISLDALARIVRPEVTTDEIDWLVGLLRGLQRDRLVRLMVEPDSQPCLWRVALPCG